jgi:hypothetical protein
MGMDNFPTVQTRFQKVQTGLQWLLARPYIWCPVLAIALLAVFLWENRNNPDWTGAYQGSQTTASGFDLSNLTPEQQAELAAAEDPDQLSALVGEFNLTQSEADLLAQQEGLEAEAEQDEFGVVDGQAVENPFAEYLENYRFMGGGSGASGSGASGSGSGSNGISAGPEFFSSPRPSSETSTAPATSALQDALTRQSEARQTNGQANGQTSQTNDQQRTRQEDSPPGTTGTAQNGGRTGTTSGQANGGQRNDGMVNGSNVNGAVPGLPPFMRTMPNMSPPPGTTGYTAPPVSAPPIQTLPNGFNNSFNNGVPQAGQGAAGMVPAAPNNNFTPGASGFSSQPPSGAGTALPPTNSFQSPNGFNTQPLPNPGATTTVPRPPGSNIGGGYINTFSNPSAPPPQ